MELCENLAELVGVPGALEDVVCTLTHEGRPGKHHPVLVLADEAWTLALEDVSILLGDGSGQPSLKEVLLTWVACHPVFHQSLNRRTKHLYSVLYRYGLGVDGGGLRLSSKAAKAMRALLG